MKNDHDRRALIHKFLEAFAKGAQEKASISHEASAKEFFANTLTCLNTQFAFTLNLQTSTIEYVTGVERVLGYRDDDFSIYQFFERQHPDDLPKSLAATTEAYRHLVAQKETTPLEAQYTSTYRIKHANGHYVHMQNVRAILAVDSNGNVLKTITRCTDLSQIPFSRVTASLACPCNSFRFETLENYYAKNFRSLLTKREVEIMELLLLGKGSFEISKILFISRHTVDKHRSNILKKVGANSTQELMMYSLGNQAE